MNTGRRGGRERDQGGPQVGVRGEGRAGPTGPTSSSWRATSTAAPRPSSASPTTRDRPLGVRSVHPRLPHRAVRRRRRGGGRDRRGHGGRAPRARAGRGRCRRPAGRLPAGGPGALHPRSTCCWSRTRSSPASRGPAPRWPASTPASSPTSTCSARPSAAASCRSPPWWPTATCSASCSPGSTARPSAATRWPAPSAARWSGCCRPASGRSGPGCSGSTCTAGSTSSSERGVTEVRGPRAVGRHRHRPGAAAAASRCAWT